jgi:hypothetical protein
MPKMAVTEVIHSEVIHSMYMATRNARVDIGKKAFTNEAEKAKSMRPLPVAKADIADDVIDSEDDGNSATRNAAAKSLNKADATASVAKRSHPLSLYPIRNLIPSCHYE